MNDPIWGLIGIANRAGKVVSGYEQSLQTIQRGRGKIVILAEDASTNTKKTFYDKSRYYNVPIYEKGSKENLGKSIGKECRSVLVCIDSGFTKALIVKLDRY